MFTSVSKEIGWRKADRVTFFLCSPLLYCLNFTMSMYYYNTKLSNISKPYSYLKKKTTLTNLQGSPVVT